MPITCPWAFFLRPVFIGNFSHDFQCDILLIDVNKRIGDECSENTFLYLNNRIIFTRLHSLKDENHTKSGSKSENAVLERAFLIFYDPVHKN